MDPNKKDVVVDPSSTPPADPNKVEPGKSAADDKDKNFAALRKRNEELEAEVAKLKGEGDEPDPKPNDKKPTTAEKVAFDRDFRDVSREWQGKKKPTAEEWAQMQKELKLDGSELRSEIAEKLDRAYEALPTVRQRREKELIDKGRREAMQQFSDDELDIGAGGGGEPEGNTPAPRLSSGEKRLLDNFGVSDKEREAIDKDANPNEWRPGPSPTRKAFVPRSS